MMRNLARTLQGKELTKGHRTDEAQYAYGRTLSFHHGHEASRRAPSCVVRVSYGAAASAW
jgi:hypothetical protein